MTWLIRFLLFARARQLFRECAAYTIAEYGDAAGGKLRGEIDPGTPLSGRLLIWAMIAEVHRQAARRPAGRTKVAGTTKVASTTKVVVAPAIAITPR